MERWTPWRGTAGAVVPLEPVLCLDKSTPTCIQARRGTCIGVHAQGVGCECKAGASRGGAAGQVETQATGRSSCSAVSSCPVVPSGRSVLGWAFSAAVFEPKRMFWNHNEDFVLVRTPARVAKWELFRLQMAFSSRKEFEQLKPSHRRREKLCRRVVDVSRS